MTIRRWSERIIRWFGAWGYGRYDTEKQVRQLNALYAVARLYINFFEPVMKLKSKQQVGSKVKREYDETRRPFNAAWIARN